MSESSADEPLVHDSPIDPAGLNVPADDSPVPAGPATLPMGARPWPGPNCLVLRATHWLTCFALGGFFLFPTVFFLVAVFTGDRKWMTTAAALAFLVCIGMALVWYRQILLPRVTFDKEAGLLLLGWGGRRGRQPLASVIGLQVMQTRKQFGGPELNIPAVTMYQLNLILDDPDERRLNVMTCDPLSARSNARAVADFLSVPVLDCAGTPEAAAAHNAEAIALGSGSSTVPSPVVIEPSPDVLLIRPRRLSDPFGRLGASLAPLFVLLCVLVTLGELPKWFTIVLVALLGYLILFSVLYHLHRQARFDRSAGMLTLGWRGRGAPRPLESVMAVEVVDGPEHRLDLVLDDPDRPRLNLITDADMALVRRAAERVASFLGVPLLAARRPASRASPPGAGETASALEELSRSPLPAGRASIRGPARVVLKGDHCLVLRPRLPGKWRLLASAVLVPGMFFCLFWFLWFRAGGQGLPVGWLLVGLLSLFSALKPLLLYRDQFDRQAGVLTLGLFGLKGRYPLADVLAVQLIPGGLVDMTPGPFGRGGEHVNYQLNLVMADTYQDRLNLTDDTDLEWTRQAGQQIADFLGVPLIDQIADGD